MIASALAGCTRHSTSAEFSCPPGSRQMGAAPPKGEEIWCEKRIDGKPVKDGPFILYGQGGGKILQGTYRDGVQVGEWTMWYENGARASIDHYRDGKQDGLHTSWYANGQKAIEGQYRNGERDGVWTRWDPTGLISHKDVYRMGKTGNP